MTTAYGAFRHKMDAVIVGYIECALWSEGCQGTACPTIPGSKCYGQDCDKSLSHDLNLSIDDLSPAASRDMEADVEGFVKSCLDERPDVFDGITPDMIGYDFWLTRNGHGAGFWDRGLGERGDWLTAMAKPFGDARLYVNANGEVECES
jgi:hypothetical protein